MQVINSYFTIVLSSFLFLVATQIGFTQVNFTANDVVRPYDGGFHFGVNPGTYQYEGGIPWTDQQLAELSTGLAEKNLPGVGVTTWRPSLPDWFLEHFGYHIRDDAFDYYDQLGLEDHTVFIGYPSPDHTEDAQYCGDRPSKVFENMYLPIWDNGENGTPYNDDNYYARYVYKLVERYGDHMKFYEVWNEPDYSITVNAQSPPGTPDSWWDKDPDPCDLIALNAPVYSYIRMLRITYEVVKTLDPTAYVCLGGIGYPSFLDAIMRNTDNPNNGDINYDFPLSGGAYFDCISFHYYPHVDKAFRYWNQSILDFSYTRHTDAAIDVFIDRRQEFEDVLFNYGYNGGTFPEKEWICSETNLPRKEANFKYGGEQVQANYAIKSAIFCQKYNIHHLHLFHLGETIDCPSNPTEDELWFLMGLYQNLMGATTQNAIRTSQGIAFKTTSDLMKDYWYDGGHTNDLAMPSNIDGAAFKNSKGDFLYVLWAKTHTDRSEASQASYSFPASVNWASNASATLTRKEWNYSVTEQTSTIGHQNIPLTGTPIFLSITAEETDCNGLTLNINSVGADCYQANTGSASVSPQNGTGPYTYNWSNGQTSSLVNNLVSGTYQITVTDSNNCEVIQSITINEPSSLNLTLGASDESTIGSNDGTITAYAGGGSPPYSYIWSNGQFGPYISGLEPGFYSITLEDSNQCQNVQSIQIFAGISAGCGTFNSSMEIDNISCFGFQNGRLKAIPQNGTPPYIYSWSNGANTQEVLNLSSDTYTVTIFDNNSCELIASSTIEEPNPLDIFLISHNMTSINANDGSIIALPSGGTSPYEYQWNTGEKDAVLTNLSAGTYILTVTDENNCTLTSEVMIDAPFQGCEEFSSSLTTANNLCFGDANGFAAASGLNGEEPYSYLWSTGEITQGIGNLPNGNYQVTITDFANCNLVEGVTINSPSELELILLPTNESNITAADGRIISNVEGGILPYSYIWSNGETANFIEDLSAGYFSLTVTDANNCQISEEVFIDANNQNCDLFAVTSNIQEVKCSSGMDGVIVLIPQNGTSPFEYLWNTGNTTADLTNIGAGTYRATITDVNDCVATIEEIISQPNPISISFTTMITGDCSDKANVQTFVEGGVPPYSYFWSNGIDEKDLIGVEEGTYLIAVTDANGCVIADQVQVEIDDLLLQVDNTILDLSCFDGMNGTINIEVQNGTPPFTYIWSNGENTQNLTNLQQGEYTVTVNDAESCQSIYTYTVGAPEEIQIDFEINHVNQSNNQQGSATAIVSGGIEPYTYLWSFGNQTSFANNLSVGSYQLTITDANSCLQSAELEITFSNSLQNLNTDVDILVYPNPGQGNPTVEISGDKKIKAKNLSIFDISGKLISLQNLEADQAPYQIELGSKNEGTYFLKLQLIDGSIKTFKYVLLP